ncbi:unnamed protein product [Closterium sp. Naga37s-1]|nr:unnamed protein product [Closterium sp. Naga37s-1]
MRVAEHGKPWENVEGVRDWGPSHFNPFTLSFPSYSLSYPHLLPLISHPSASPHPPLSRCEAPVCLTAPQPPCSPYHDGSSSPPCTSPAGASQVWSGGALIRCEARLCLSAPLDPPSLPLAPTPLPPHFPRRRLPGASQVWSGGPLIRCEARLCLSAPLDPPSLPLAPTPLPPHFPRRRLPGVVWWRTHQAPPRCGLVAHSSGVRRASACLPR